MLFNNSDDNEDNDGDYDDDDYDEDGEEYFVSLQSRHIFSVMASQITSLTIAYSTVYSGTDQRKHQSSASLAFVRGIHLWPMSSPHNEPVTRKMFPFDDVIMFWA